MILLAHFYYFLNFEIIRLLKIAVYGFHKAHVETSIAGSILLSFF